MGNLKGIAKVFAGLRSSSELSSAAAFLLFGLLAWTEDFAFSFLDCLGGGDSGLEISMGSLVLAVLPTTDLLSPLFVGRTGGWEGRLDFILASSRASIGAGFLTIISTRSRNAMSAFGGFLESGRDSQGGGGVVAV